MLRCVSIGAILWFVVMTGIGCGSPPSPAVADSESAVTTASPTASGSYQVKLRRPVSAGFREQMSVAVVEKQTKITRMGQKVLGQEVSEKRVEFQGLQTVVAVNEHGQITASQYLIEKCLAQTDAGTSQLLAPGQVLHVVRGNPPVVTIDQAPVPDEQVTLLNLALHMSTPGPPTEDAALGTAEAQLAGASWPIDPVLTAASLTKENIIIDAAGVRGQTKLAGVIEAEGRECIELQVGVQINAIQMPSLPQTATLTNGQMEVNMRGLFPTDLVTRPVRNETIMRGRFEISIVNGATVELLTERHEMKAAVPIS